jgi:hypothetical protein
MLKSSKHRAQFTILGLLISAGCLAFAFANDYFFPIRPGEQNYLSGTMGELRTSHFHAGIDIKTSGVEGLPVYAAQSGYVSRIKVSPTGYGHVLYIAHPTLGTTTVYGHLKKYREDIAEYIRNEQYARKRFAVEVFPSVTQFTVEKGDVVAFSGNSGSSGGPHLHFEIRDRYQRPVNPLKYNFAEIRDNIPPTVQRVALKTLDIHARINGRFGTFEFNPYRSGGHYAISDRIELSGRIGVMVMAYDRLDGASNRNGIPHLEMELDGHTVFAVDVDTFAFSQSREILTFRDHGMKHLHNRTYQKLYIDDGNNLPFYDRASTSGILQINDSAHHTVRLLLKDAYQNHSEVHFGFKGKATPEDTAIVTSRFDSGTFHVSDNTLRIVHPKKDDRTVAGIFANRTQYTVQPAYSVNGHCIYLWDLRRGLPDSVRLGDMVEYPAIGMMVPPGVEFSYYQPHIDLYFTRNTLFDTAYIKTAYWDDAAHGLEVFEIGDPAQPLKGSYTAVLKPSKQHNHRARVAAYSTEDYKTFNYQGGDWNANHFEFRAREYGRYVLMADTIPPDIRIIEQNSRSIRCYVQDDLSGVGQIVLHVGGKWVLMHYDPKRNYCWSEKQDPSVPFSGLIELQVLDNEQNERIYSATL